MGRKEGSVEEAESARRTVRVPGKAEYSFTALPAALSVLIGFSLGHTMSRCNIPDLPLHLPAASSQL